MSQKPKKALPLLPEEEKELFPKGKPEHPEKLIRDAGKLSLFFNRSVFTKRAYYLIRNYWRLGMKRTAIAIAILYLAPFGVFFGVGFISTFNEDKSPVSTILFAVFGTALIIWMLIYYFAPNIMVWHQTPIYKEFEADYNDVRHDLLNTGNRKKKKH